MSARVLRQPARYLIVGLWNTAFGLAVFSILYLSVGQALGYIAVLSIAQVIAVLQAHAAQRAMVWRSHARYLPELFRFSVIYAVAYLANVLLLALAVDGLDFPVLPAQWVISGILIVLTFVVQRAWTFRSSVTLTDSVGESVSDREGRDTN